MRNLAPLYGVKAPAGGSFTKVELDPKQRAGLLTQTAFLARYGRDESDPILRGAFVNHTLLCLDLGAAAGRDREHRPNLRPARRPTASGWRP